MFSLIERFYQADAGRVLVDGRDVTDWPLAELRAAIGYVEQDAPVLSGTLRDNLLLGAPCQRRRAGPGAAHHPARRPGRPPARRRGHPGRPPRHPTVGRRAPARGDRQGPAAPPRLLLLDEATSQLDAVNEAALRDTIADAARTTTVLVVAHRLSTVTMADRIVVWTPAACARSAPTPNCSAPTRCYAELAATQFLVAAD